jgi:ribosome-binding factor A
MSSIKIERLNHTIQQEISMILQTEVKDEHIKFVTITGVDTTSDLSFSKVYYTVLDKEKIDSTKEALEKASSFIRTCLAERIDIRHTPELKFIYDTSIAYGEHIEEIIENIHEKDNKE